MTASQRVPEAQTLLNPVFGAYLLASSVQAANDRSGRPLPWPSAFLVLPLVLPVDTRNDLPRQASRSMAAWLTDHPHHQAAFGERAPALTAYTRASLRSAVRHRAVEVVELGLTCPRRPKAAGIIAGEEVADCARRAALVGRWLAVLEPVTAFTLLGVRP